MFLWNDPSFNHRINPTVNLAFSDLHSEKYLILFTSAGKYVDVTKRLKCFAIKMNPECQLVSQTFV